MKIALIDHLLYVDNVLFSQAAMNHDCPEIPVPVDVRYCHTLGRNRVFAEGIGWVGGHHADAVVLGRVHSRDGVIPCGLTESRLTGVVESALEDGKRVMLEIGQ